MGNSAKKNLYKNQFNSLSFSFFLHFFLISLPRIMLTVHPMSFTHASEFRIQLDDDHVILHGSAEESAGAILRGSVILNCHEQIKVKSITLKLIGITNVSWCEGNII